MAIAFCPACRKELDFEPWEADIPSHEICPFCGIQFGYNDARPDLRERIYSEWRDAWIANGRQPLTGEQWSEVKAGIVRRAAENSGAS